MGLGGERSSVVVGATNGLDGRAGNRRRNCCFGDALSPFSAAVFAGRGVVEAAELASGCTVMIRGGFFGVALGAYERIRVRTNVVCVSKFPIQSMVLHSLSIRMTSREQSVGFDVKWHMRSLESYDCGGGGAKHSCTQYRGSIGR